MTPKNCSNSATLQKKRALQLILGVAAPLVLVSTLVGAVTRTRTDIASPNIFTENFEKGDLSKWKKDLCCDHSAEIVSSPTRAGDRAVKFTLKKSDPYVANSKRAELGLGTVAANSERWYGFSNYLPQDWVNDPSFEITAQFHSKPDSALGEDWRSPALTLAIYEDKWRISNRWDSKQVTKNNNPGPEGGSEGWWVGEIEKEKWTDWVFHVKWSHKSDGLIEVWKDGKLVLSKTGANTYNDERGPFLKMGIYKPQWKYKPERSKATKRVIYFDELRVGDASASYEDVVPTNKTKENI